MGSKSLPEGVEVPIIGSDSIKWVEVSVPSTSTPALPAPPHLVANSAEDAAPSAEDAASFAVIGNPPTYFIWRIHKSQPHSLEIVELCGDEEIQRIGLRIIYPDSLFPFAFLCKDEIGSGTAYLLYTLTVTGVAYLVRLKDISNYISCSVIPHNEMVEYNTQINHHHGVITSAAATAGCIVVGSSDGSVFCLLLGMLDPGAPGFMNELRDDAVFGRLWGLMSRSRTVSAVQDLVILELHGKKLLFVLHSDGTLRVWDLLNYSRIFNHTMSLPTLTGTIFTRLWMGETCADATVFPLAMLQKSTLEDSLEIIYTYSLHISLGDKIVLLVKPLMKNISLEEGGLIDVKLTSEKIWILKDDGLVMHDLFGPNIDGGVAHCYTMQEAFIADQLFQSPEHCSDDLLWLAHTIYSSLKEQILSFVSSIFLRRLLLPGVHLNTVLRATLQEYNRHFADSEFHSLTFDGLKKEILSLIEHEGISESPDSIVYRWKGFCTRYFHNWCKSSTAYGLFINSSTGALGLIRKNSISLFRCLEDMEILAFGSFDDLGDVMRSQHHFANDGLESDILFEVLQCISGLSQQLGKAASAIFYESLLSAPNISSEDIVPQLLKILEIGYDSSIPGLLTSELGADVAWEKEVADHKNLRKFSADMFLSLHALCQKATTWGKVLDVIQNYVTLLVPRKIAQKLDSDAFFDIYTSITVQATSQVAKMMFESAMDILFLLSYLVSISAQIHLLHNDVFRIQNELVPMIQEIVTEWHIIHYIGTTPSESPAVEDFSSQLSSLQIDNIVDRRSWNERLGTCDFTLACILLLNIRSSSEEKSNFSFRCLPDPRCIISAVRDFTSWIIWGRNEGESSIFFSHSTEIALILLRHGQYGAVEYLLTIVDAHSRKEKTSTSLQSAKEYSVLLHLLGCCLLAQAQCGLHEMLKERKVCEAVRCFFRAASMQGASQALQSLSYEAGMPHLGFTGCMLDASWKLCYYQWAMQIFERYNMSEAACQFALSALEQVDDAFGLQADGSDSNPVNESPVTVKGRLWANVFKFTLDLNHYYDAYCSIISNPDEESKSICLRRFIIVLYERGAVKILCDGQLPLIGLAEKVERELAWKADRSDISAKPSPYKLLYAFEMHRHNWRKAASYIYQYSARLKTEADVKDQPYRSLVLQERLSGLSAAMNALHLVHPAYAWIPLLEELQKEHYPNKKAMTLREQSGHNVQNQGLRSYVDIKKLENECVLTSAEYLLSLANVKGPFAWKDKASPELVDLLVQSNLYDMALTVVLKFWKGSEMQRELERVFVAMSLKCCPNRVVPMSFGNDQKMHGHLLTSSKNEVILHGSLEGGLSAQQSKGTSQWETLEFYLEKYKGFHPRLPVVVAESLLCADSQIELPLWLVHMFKGIRRESLWGMTGNASNPASLFRLYVDYGRYAEATNLLLEFIASFASMRPMDVIHRKRSFAVWFPYTVIERLWCHLEELIRLGRKVDQCEKLKRLLEGALLNHINQLKVDSDDVQSSAVRVSQLK